MLVVKRRKAFLYGMSTEGNCKYNFLNEVLQKGLAAADSKDNRFIFNAVKNILKKIIFLLTNV